MFLTVHATSGIIIGQYFTNPIVAFIMGYLSHFVLDIIPHGDDKLFIHYLWPKRLKALITTAAIDSVLAIVWLILIFVHTDTIYSTAILTAIIGTVLPDFLLGLYQVKKIKVIKWNYDLSILAHSFLKEKRPSIFWGFFIQIIFFIALIIYL